MTVFIILALVSVWAFVAYHDIHSSSINNPIPEIHETNKLFQTKDGTRRCDIKKLMIFNASAFIIAFVIGLLIYNLTEFGAFSFATFPLFALVRGPVVLKNYRLHKKYAQK